MRIAVIGPQNTGKSTFINDFLTEFPHYKTQNKTYRDVIEKHGLSINQLTGIDSQKAIRDFMYSQIKENRNHDFIFDRCLIDNYVYTYVKYEQGEISKKFVEETEEMLLGSLKFIDVYFFIPTSASIALVNDGTRDIDTLYIDVVNNNFLKILFELSKKHNINIKVISGTREDRIKQVKKIV